MVEIPNFLEVIHHYFVGRYGKVATMNLFQTYLNAMHTIFCFSYPKRDTNYREQPTPGYGISIIALPSTGISTCTPSK